jgi:predicted nucleotidyltransferase
MNNIELKLLKRIITEIYVNEFNLVRIEEKHILGIYKWGSYLWGSQNDNSDLDYCIIISDKSSIWKFHNVQYIQKESKDIDLHIISESYYKSLVNDCEEMSLSLYFQENPILKYDYETTLNLQKLRKSFSTKANNSYVKSKKKLTVEDKNEENYNLAIKSMFHSIRIIDFGIEVALRIKGEKTNKIDFTDIGYSLNHIKSIFKNKDWSEVHKIMKPEFNSFSTVFKKLAPKE